MELKDIMDRLESQLRESLDRCGLVYRVFSRVKTVESMRHKIVVKYHNDPNQRLQDVLGMRIVLYYPEDVELLGFYYSCSDLVRASVDKPEVDTFRPQRLNLTKTLPDNLISDFRSCLPEEFADRIENTYEVQIRTVFSEGWHEVEHDMRYKCKEDWANYGRESRVLNGMIALLETTEWNMSALFDEMARKNFMRGELRPMLRNKLRIHIADDDFSPRVRTFLTSHRDIVEQLFNSDRMVLLIALLTHKHHIALTFDNLVFLINRIDIMNSDLLKLDTEISKGQIEQFLKA